MNCYKIEAVFKYMSNYTNIHDHLMFVHKHDDLLHKYRAQLNTFINV